MNARERAENTLKQLESLLGSLSHCAHHGGPRDKALDILATALTPPPGHIIDDTGTVRKVLGTLPITADGCVIGTEATIYSWWKPQYMEDDGIIQCSVVGSVVCAPHLCYSTREAAKKAKEEGR